MSSLSKAPGTGRRAWWTFVGLALVAVAGVCVWLVMRAEQRASPYRLPQVTQDVKPRRPDADGVDVNAEDLLSGTWDPLHKRGLSALRAGRFHDAELAFRSATAVIQKALAPQLARDRSAFRKDRRYSASILHLSNINRLLGRNRESRRLLRLASWPSNDTHAFMRYACRGSLRLDEGNALMAGGHWHSAADLAVEVFGRNSGERLRALSRWAGAIALRHEPVDTNLVFAQAADILDNNRRDDLSMGTYKYCLGQAYRHYGCLAQATDCLTDAVTRLGRALPDNHPDLAEVRYALGDCYLRRGKTAEARALLQQALETFESLKWPKHTKVGDVLLALGKTHEATREHAAARDLYARAVANYRGWESMHPGGRGYNSFSTRKAVAAQQLLADAHLALGEHSQAEAVLVEAETMLRSVWAKRSHPARAACIFRRLGRCYMAMEQFDKAAAAFEKANTGDRRNFASSHPQRVANRLALAEAYRRLGKADQAEPLEREARRIRHRRLGQGDGDPGDQLLWDAEAAAAEGRYDEALDSMIRRHRLRRPVLAALLPACTEQAIVQAAQQEAWACHYMFSASLRCGDPERVARWFLEVAMAYKSMAMDAQADQLAAVHASDDPELKKLATRIERVRQQIVACRLASEEPETTTAPAADAVDAGWPTTAPATRNLLRAEVAVVNTYSEDGPGKVGVTVLSDNVGGKYTNVWRSSYVPGLRPAPIGRHLDLEKRLGELEARMARRCAPLARLKKLRRCDWEAFDRALPDDAAFISYIYAWDMVEAKALSTRRRYLALLARKGKAPMLFDLGDPNTIDNEARRFMRSLNQAPAWIRDEGEPKAESHVRRHGSRVSQLLIYPLWPYVKDCKRLIISPDGVLSELPFHLLREPTSPTNYLVQTRRVSFVTSARDVLDFGRRTSGAPRAMVLANPDFDSRDAQAGHAGQRGIDTRHLAGLRWKPLPGTGAEARSLAKLFENSGVPVTVKAGAEATKSALLNVPAPRFLHVATHGFFLPDPLMSYSSDPFIGVNRYVRGRKIKPANPLLYSGLALAGANGAHGIRNGVVTAYEMKWINLWGTELVTLSACETGLGYETHGAGVRGLRQALLQAGARRIVTSLWKVPDKQTAELMEAFYRRLLKGRPADAALREAMLEVRDARLDGHPAAHPYLWGGFILIGDPGPVRVAGPSPKDPQRGPIHGEK